MRPTWLNRIAAALLMTAALAPPAAAQTAMPPVAKPQAAPPNPDPLAVSILYNTIIDSRYIGDDIERLATRQRADAFAKCIIEHRSETKFKPTGLWEFLSKSAQLVRAKGVVNSYWPPARRYRDLKARTKEFDFMLAQPILGTKTLGPYNALDPGGPTRKGVTFDAIQLEMGATGMPGYETCLHEPRRQAPAPTDDDLDSE
jgi:hypothetical protein